jgi:periplasmic protein CpxP/Spy
MNKKALFLLPVTVALMFAATPLIPGFTNAAVAVPAHAGQWGGGMKSLNLTEDQKAQIKEIRASAKQEMDNIFTPEQKTLRQQARQQHQRPKLNLTDDQKAHIKALRQKTKSQINDVLTSEQRTQLQQMRTQHKNHGRQHKPEAGTAN